MGRGGLRLFGFRQRLLVVLGIRGLVGGQRPELFESKRVGVFALRVHDPRLEFVVLAAAVCGRIPQTFQGNARGRALFSAYAGTSESPPGPSSVRRWCSRGRIIANSPLGFLKGRHDFLKEPMWTQWIYVQETGKELEYMQLTPPEPYVPGPTLVHRIWRLYKLKKLQWQSRSNRRCSTLA